MKKSVPRGSYEEQMTSFEGVDLTAVSWKDNKPVTFLSSYVGAEPVSLVERFDKVNKTRIKITCPRVIKEYNAHMGGVDLLDSFIDLKGTEGTSSVLNLCQYRLELAEVLANINNASELCNKRGRPSTSNSVEMSIQVKKSRGPVQHVPPKDIRTDNVGHWPDDCTHSRCKMPGCKGYTQSEKCGVTLCLTKSRNCFKNCHM
ncbi:unnamed protein product [Parnassius apollo]|uniref:(apollo) hypothetical protein n=1 Tax=Parnassius apollo TaxID=110799 RepID=A0A8S3XQK0_PARAO|nr:unnamed protein product [Parnassius apollo]